VLIDSQHIAGSPFKAVVTASAASAKHSAASSRMLDLRNGAGAQEDAVAGSPSTLTIYASDVHGNKAQYDPFAEQDDFVVYLAAMGQVEILIRQLTTQFAIRQYCSADV